MIEHTSDIFGKIVINKEKRKEELHLNHNGDKITIIFHNAYGKLDFFLGIIDKYYEINEHVKNLLINRFSNDRQNIRLHRKFQWFFDEKLNASEIVAAINNFELPILNLYVNKNKEIRIMLKYIHPGNNKALGVALDEELKMVLLMVK